MPAPAGAHDQPREERPTPAPPAWRSGDSAFKRRYSPLHILVVEDDPATARALSRALTQRGYSVRSADCYREAVKVASVWPPDLLLADIGLPGRDGWEVMRTMRQAYPGLKGIVVSGHADPSDIAASRDAGFAEHLAKPVDLDYLIQVIDIVAAS